MDTSDVNDLWDRYVDLGPVNGHTEPKDSANTHWYDALVKTRHVGFLDTLERALIAFTPGERLALYLLSVTLGLSSLLMVGGVNALASVTVPARGGTLVEGEVGPARFINPLLTMSQPDQDIAALVYSGLMRMLPNGSFVPDLASDYTISADGRTYTFHIRPNATFQDGTRVTSADVVFTVEKATDPSINSPHRADWTGVSVSAPDDRTVIFTLPHAYAPFMSNTTLGILPKARWQNTSAEEFPFSPLNTRPIGSGPYKIDNLITDQTGAAARYDLSAFDHYTLGNAYLSHISFVFYPDTTSLINALNAHQIDAAAALSPEDLPSIKRTDVTLEEAPLPRIYGIFFNQSHNDGLADAGVRHALEIATDKEQLVRGVLAGHGAVLDGPIPPGSHAGAAGQSASISSLAASSSTSTANQIAAARAALAQSGWTYDDNTGSWSKNSAQGGSASGGKKTLALSLATADNPELVATARALAANWQAAGIQVTVHVYPLADLNTTVIRPRAYDALLFGEDVGPALDLYAFWHSSQRNDPGLNLALYANPKADALLSDARATTDPAQRVALYQQFATILSADNPAIFLYSPDFLYVIPKHLRGVALGALSGPSDRFENVFEWYADTEQVWNIFAPHTTLVTH